jgi:hypothetical protein
VREPGALLTYDDLKLLPVTREIRYLATPNPHVCDWRCKGAHPKGDCMCECGSRNHGIDFRCEAAWPYNDSAWNADCWRSRQCLSSTKKRPWHLLHYRHQTEPEPRSAAQPRDCARPANC